ncbi:hypothetical protein L211DRAFT_836242 [Terfezia boudieri ATCC MYA-4762]|uniref:Rhodopsin domain-containing protein n=1 Tax=Terfezia boudieri ATCC MYA-4762 TaxID=1051890 RepID=A0A3N4LVB0_9PEZI|nr:hypothetical protein L211DRAFT_836242 [Terfezia boudieri ATCC MYA-4762]
MSTRENINQAGRLIGVVAGLCAFSCVVVSLRVWVRVQLTKQGLGLDDAVMLAATALLIAESTVICLTTKYGLGRHIEFIDPTAIVPFLQLAYTSILTYVTLIFAIKQSLLLFYWRLTTSSRHYRAWCWGFIVLNTVLWFTFFIVGVFSCNPIQYFWDKEIPGGSCVNLERAYLTNAAFTVATDIAALLLPVRVVWKLTASRSSKLQLSAMMMFGFFICIASFVRMTTLFNLNTVTDITWVLVRSHIWSMIEINVGIVTICAPAIKPIFTRHVWGHVLGLKPNSSNAGRSRNGGRSLPENPKLPDSFDKPPGSVKHSKKKDFNKDEITTERFIEHEMAQYGVMGFDEERGGKGGTNSASTSQRDLAGGSDGETELQRQ